MDLTPPDWLVSALQGSGATGALWALVHVVRRRGEASAKRDEASAAGVLAIVGQVAELNSRCKALEAEVDELRSDLESEREALQAERDMRRHFEDLAKRTLLELQSTKEAAILLKRQFEESLALTKPTTRSWRPPRK